MNIQRSLVFVCAAALLASAFPASAMTNVSCAQLSRSLRVGMSGQDVKDLQVFLNQNKETRVSDMGDGSPGKETTYFGPRTKAAVIRFQNLYKQEVLSPAGLTTGSGFVGAMTRAKIITLCSSPKPVPSQASAPIKTPSATTPTPLPASSSQAQSSATAGPLSNANLGLSFFATSSESAVPEVMYPSGYRVAPGDAVTVYGEGFAATDNTVHIGSLTIQAIRDPFGSLNITIPANAPSGKFDLWVTNAKGESNKSFIVIANALVAPPLIKDISSQTSNRGADVILSGSDFLAEGNDIYVGDKIIKNVRPINGTTLSFSVGTDIVAGLSGEELPGTITLPVWIYVVNANGVSNGLTHILKM